MPSTWVPDAPRVFNLGLRERTIDHVAKTVTLSLASDEALLIDYAPLTEDTGARAHQASIRAVVDYVLGKIGAALAPGGPDADATAYWALTNTLSNPSVEGSIVPWVAAGNCTAFGASVAMPGTGTASFGWESLGAGQLAFAPHALSQGPSVTPGRSYVLSGYALADSTTPARSIRACIRWLNGAGTPVGPDVEGAIVTLNPSTWSRCSIIGTAPVGASRAEVFWRVDGSTAAGQRGYADAAMFYEGNELVPYFDGDTPDTATYLYAWADPLQPHDAASTREPTTEREPGLFVWKPWTTAWEFLQPLLTPASLRLFCDELRVWRLIDPAEYQVPGAVQVSPDNAVTGADTISREDVEVFSTGVVVTYSWVDGDGIPRTAYDSAGTPEKVYRVEYRRPYPGPGAAAAILVRRAGTGRSMDVSGLMNWAATPGMVAQISLPVSPRLEGKVSSVRFSLADDALMDLGTRSLIDIVPGSIDALDGSIDALAGTIDEL